MDGRTDGRMEGWTESSAVQYIHSSEAAHHPMNDTLLDNKRFTFRANFENHLRAQLRLIHFPRKCQFDLIQEV